MSTIKQTDIKELTHQVLTAVEIELNHAGASPVQLFSNEIVDRVRRVVRANLEKRTSVQPQRFARVDVEAFAGFARLTSVRGYLPPNYSAWLVDHPKPFILIAGYDEHGWTLDGYVIPRLATGLIAARETDEDGKSHERR
jgi:hypothetical protein